MRSLLERVDVDLEEGLVLLRSHQLGLHEDGTKELLVSCNDLLVKVGLGEGLLLGKREVLL